MLQFMFIHVVDVVKPKKKLDDAPLFGRTFCKFQ